MIFCAKKCAISGLCTSAHLHRQVEDAGGAQSSTPSRNCYFRVPASASLWQATADRPSFFVVPAEVTDSERTARDERSHHSNDAAG